MDDDTRVRDSIPRKIQMASLTDVEIENSVKLRQRLNKTPCKSTHQALTKRKPKRIACGHSKAYFWMYVVYYGVLSVAGTMSLWWCRDKETISFVDCTFNAISTLTATGLASVLLRDFTPLGLIILIVLMLLGNTVFVSLLPVYVRRIQFYRHDTALNASNSAADKLGFDEHNNADDNYVDIATEKISSNTERQAVGLPQPDQILKSGVGQGHSLGVSSEIKSEGEGAVANCCGKSRKDQESLREIGLLERQALVTLSWIVPIYMFVIMSFGFVCIICYTSASSKGSSRIRALYEAEEVNPVQTAIFLSVSAFTNAGLAPLDENLVPFAGSTLVLVPLAVLILAGNTMFPPSLRFIIWGISTLKRANDPQRKVYEYMLQFPRRCHTHLFPQMHSLWLVATVVAFNTVDLVAFCALEWNSAAVLSNTGVKLMDGIFQSINTRSPGMNVLPLSSLSLPLLIFYTAMMYIAAYPVFLSRQHSRPARTNVNQVSDKRMSENFEEAVDDKLSLQFTRLFTWDSTCIFVYIFLICTIEIHSTNSDPLNYSIFSIVFEVISAYGNVGLSLGYSCEQWVRASADTPYAEAAAACKDVPYSFSGKWRVSSKLILVSGMLMGRHRTLPNDRDSAIPIVTPCELCDSCLHTSNPNWSV